MTQLTDKGKALIKGFEGCRLEAYQDVAGVWTIGYGHTAGVHEGAKWTQEQADAALDAEVGMFASRVQELVSATISTVRFEALVSLAYNIGLAAFEHSTLLKCLNRGDYHQAALQFTVWNKAGGKFNPGLLARRTQEMYLFCSGRGD